MATAEEALIKKSGDIYRSILHDEAENTTQWRHGGPPEYDSVNQLFEEGRTKVLDPFSSSPLCLYLSKLCVRVCQDFFFFFFLVLSLKLFAC
jgi:hypothetical protein